MNKKISVAVLGSTGYVGLELINILSNHPNVVIEFLGSSSNYEKNIDEFDKRLNFKELPKLSSFENINFNNIDLLFLALPHKISQEYIGTKINNFKKLKIIDLSADFRLDNQEVYLQNYDIKHSCPHLLKEFTYGLSEINFNKIKNSNLISIPGCYPTSILLPLIPLFESNLLETNNIIIDSKSGYSGAGKKFNKSLVLNDKNYNFYNYNTNNHRHICEIYQELSKFNQNEIKFSFNPHILPIFRGMMSTIYCDLKNSISIDIVYSKLCNFYENSNFVKILDKNDKADFNIVQNSNYCYIKLYKHLDSSKVIIVSLLDNLLKGASGQAVQCMNLMYGFEEKTGLNIFNSD